MKFDRSLKKKEISLIIFFMLLNIQIVKSMGITQISPVDSRLTGENADLKLKQEDYARFYFQIQALNSNGKQSCSIFISGMDPLVIALDEKEVILEANEIKNVYGNVSVPKNAPIKIYTGSLAVHCTPKIEDVSGSLLTHTMGLGVKIEVVEREEKTGELEEKKMMITPYSLGVVVLILIVTAIVIYWSKREKVASFKPELNVTPTQ
jgi:hypothetical protein